MDSTYQVNAENYPLYMIAAQDSSGTTIRSHKLTRPALRDSALIFEEDISKK